MNNMIVKLGVRLFLFCLIAAIALAITNEVTKGPIAEQALKSKMAALNTVMPGCTYEEADIGELEEGSELDELFIAKDKDGNIVGYAITASPNGYGGEIPITFGISAEGHITQVYVGSLQETAGLGTKVGEADFKDQFIGIAADDATLREDVDTISGASISSGAFLRAAEDALAYSKNVLGITPAVGDKDAILAAYNAANGGEGETEEVPVTTHTASVKGFDAFDVNVDVDGNGKIVAVSVPAHKETEGFGADLIADKAVFDALVGQDIATAKIDVRTGATLTSNAINEALSKVAAEVSGGGAGKTYDVTGFAPFKVAIELDDSGKIVSVTVPEHGETPGFGADLIADTAVFDALAGQDIAAAQIDVKSGATLTSNAINDALAQAAKDFAGGGDAAVTVPGDPYTVKGMNKFTIYIELDGDKISSISVPQHEETPGLGAALLTEEALAPLVGKSISEAKVDTVSGSTLTSNALNAALGMAAAANGFEHETEEAPKADTSVKASFSSGSAKTEETKTETADKAGKVTSVDVTGFQAFTVEIGLDEAGKITSVVIPKHDETPGFGADLIADTAVFEALIGQDIATAQIDVRSGATLTSNAINEALAKAASENGFAAEKTEEAPKAEASVSASFSSGSAKTEETKPEPAEQAGNVTRVDVTGFADFTVEIGLDEAGKITSVAIPQHGETPGFGADLIADTAVFEALVGQDIATAQIDVRSGATLTSNAINEALKKAAAENGFAAEKTEEAPKAEASVKASFSSGSTKTEETKTETADKAGKVTSVEVTGFQAFTVEIGLDEAGKITSVVIPQHGETPGFGADLIADTAVFEALVGQDIATAQIDVKSGATLTSNAINEALAKAAAENGFAAEKTEEAPKAAASVKASFSSGSTKTEETKTETADKAGKVTSVEVTGFQAFTVEIGLDEAGKITSVVIPQHGETPGFGADLIADTAVFEALVGQDIATAQIDVKSGATLTSNAINEALAKAAAENGFAAADDAAATASEAQNSVPAEKTVHEEVTGFQAFTVDITVDGEGKILRVEIPKHEETPGFGADLIEDKAVFEALIGQELANAQIDVKSGATLTSNAINDALKHAAEEVGK